MGDFRRQERLGYLVAVLVTAAATLIRWMADPLFGDHLPFVTYFPAIIVVAWYGGLRPALLATALSFLAAVYLFVPPRYSWLGLTGSNRVGVGMYLVGSLTVAFFGGALRAAQLRAAEAEALTRQRGELLRITLASIGDAVITTDPRGHVTYLNAVACELTGWDAEKAAGKPLSEIFKIVNEDTRQPVESPVEKVLKLGKIIGLANHTVLIARDGTERPIDDSAAPIRDDKGNVAGVVLTFRDISERKRAENALRQSERELADFFDNAVLGLHWVGPDGTVLRANQAELDLLGYGREEYLGRPIADFHADAHVIGDILRRLQGGEKLHDYPARLRCKDGSIKDVLIDSSVLREKGEFIHTRCFTRDVTALKEAEARLRASEEQLRLVTDIAPVLLARCDAEGRYKFVNRAYTDRFGLRPDDVIGRRIPDVVGEEAYAAFRPYVEVALAGQAVEFEIEIPYRRVGKQFMHVAYVPERDPAGQVVGLVAAIVNITDRRRAEKALEESEATLRAFYDHSPVFMGVVEPTGDGDVLHLYDNPQSCRFFGVRVGSTAGRRALADLGGSPQVVAEWLARYRESEEANGPVRFEHQFAAADGPRWLAATVCPIGPGPAGRTRFCYVAEDVTDRRLAVEALRQADRRKDDFLALLAHELRNPMAPLRNGLHILGMAGSDAEAVTEAREMMTRQLTQLVRIVDDLLDVSRITRNKLDLRKERIDLAAVIQSAVETCRPLLEERGQRLAVELPPEPIPLDADLTRLAQVFANLLNNSAKYTPRGGQVRVAAERQGGQVVVTVTDTGIGIPRESLGSIFDMFSQVDRALEKTTGGLGIGLSLVKGLVEMHGGTVVADSAGENRGSVFTVRLPIAPIPDKATRVTPSAQRAVTPKRRVLVVDDNRDGANSLATLLRLSGNEVRVAHDGLAGVQAAEEFRPDLTLMDVGMPRLNGLDATRRIREQAWGKNLVVVAMTGWGQERDRQLTMDAGCNGHLVKPVDLATLERLLAGLPPASG